MQINIANAAVLYAPPNWSLGWFPPLWLEVAPLYMDTGAAFSPQCCTSHPGVFNHQASVHPPRGNSWWDFLNLCARCRACTINHAVIQSVFANWVVGHSCLPACLCLASVQRYTLSMNRPPPFQGGWWIRDGRMSDGTQSMDISATWPSRDPLGGSSPLVVSVRCGGITA